MKTNDENLDVLMIKFSEYLQSIDNEFCSRYYFNFYYPYIKINKDNNVVVRIAIYSHYRFNNRVELKNLSVNELALLNKYLPIYYTTYGLEQSIFDVYREELIKMMNNKIRKDKLNKIC